MSSGLETNKDGGRVERLANFISKAKVILSLFTFVVALIFTVGFYTAITYRDFQEEYSNFKEMVNSYKETEESVSKIKSDLNDLNIRLNNNVRSIEDIKRMAESVRRNSENIEKAREVSESNSINIERSSVRIQEVSRSSVPPGLVAFFSLSNCPSGWAAEDNVRGRYIVGVNAPGRLGATIGTALRNEENRATGAHTHSYKDHYMVNNPTERYEGLRGVTWCGNCNPGLGKATMTTASSGGVAGTNAPYIQLLPCKKQ